MSSKDESHPFLTPPTEGINFVPTPIKNTIKVIILLMLSVLDQGCSSTQPHLYYESTMIKLAPPKEGEHKGLLAKLPSALKGRRVFHLKGKKRILVLGKSHNELDRLSHAELRALWVAHDDNYLGAELDLKILTAPRESTPVTVWVALNGDMTVEGGEWSKTAIPKNAEEIEHRWKIGPLKTAKGATWSKRALRSIHLALSKLSSEERALLEGIPFVRKQSGSSKEQAALYQEENCEATILIFNTAIQSEMYSFSGEAQDALPATVHPILHEIGHALHSAPGRRLQCEYLKGLKAHNQLVLEHNRAGGAQRSKLAARLKQSEKSLNAIQKKVDRWTEKGPVLSSYAQRKGAQQGPTLYGETSLKESFAESFALFRVDPAALKRVFPKVYEWFKGGGHLREIKARD